MQVTGGTMTINRPTWLNWNSFTQPFTRQSACTIYYSEWRFAYSDNSANPRDILAIWTKDADLTVVNTTATAGNYIGNGDPDDPESCPLPSGDTSATGRQGTLCTFFKYVSGGLQATNKFVSLSPAYKTKFVPVKDDDGQWKSSVYFECHYFDVSLNPATGQPFWTAKSHVDLDGEAKKIDGRWLLTHVSSSAVPVPVP
ncbi:MAG: hypothetical protein WB660_08355 [Candidatus Sulfotelmatobacter sp.]